MLKIVSTTVDATVPLLLVVVVGWIFRVAGVTSHAQLVELGRFMTYVLIPFMGFASIASVDFFNPSSFRWIEIVAYLAHRSLALSLCAAASLVVGRGQHFVERTVLLFSSIAFVNYVVVGVPIIEALFGVESINLLFIWMTFDIFVPFPLFLTFMDWRFQRMTRDAQVQAKADAQAQQQAQPQPQARADVGDDDGDLQDDDEEEENGRLARLEARVDKWRERSVREWIRLLLKTVYEPHFDESEKARILGAAQPITSSPAAGASTASDISSGSGKYVQANELEDGEGEGAVAAGPRSRELTVVVEASCSSSESSADAEPARTSGTSLTGSSRASDRASISSFLTMSESEEDRERREEGGVTRSAGIEGDSVGKNSTDGEVAATVGELPSSGPGDALHSEDAAVLQPPRRIRPPERSVSDVVRNLWPEMRHMAKMVLQSIAKSPIIYGCAAGAIWSLSGLTMPKLMATWVNYFTACVGGLALYSLGIFIAENKLVSCPLRWALLLLFLKHIASPFLTVLPSRLFGLTPRESALAFVAQGLPMPTALFLITNMYVFNAGKYSAVIMTGCLLILPITLFQTWVATLLFDWDRG